MVKWSALSDRLESVIDSQMSEEVQLIPYKDTGGGYTPPTVDTSRSRIDAIGYVIGRGTFMAGTGAIQQRRADADLLLAILPKYLTSIRQHDRVILKERSLTTTYEISYVEESSYRPKLHLLLDKGAK